MNTMFNGRPHTMEVCTFTAMANTGNYGEQLPVTSWTEKEQVHFIEAIMLGKVPFFELIQNTTIDGKTRIIPLNCTNEIATLINFVNDKLTLNNLKYLQNDADVANKTFHEMTESIRVKFYHTEIAAVSYYDMNVSEAMKFLNY